jgi:hypothetical protein
MPNGDGGCNFCGRPGTHEGIDHEADCPYSTGVFPEGYTKYTKAEVDRGIDREAQRRIDILTGKRIAPESEEDDGEDVKRAMKEEEEANGRS